MKNTLFRILIIIVALPFLIALFPITLAYIILAVHNPNKKRQEEIQPTGFVQAYGRNVYDGKGKLFYLKGVNLGNWFVQENWMCVSTVDGFQTGVYTQKRGNEAMLSNPNLTQEQIKRLYDMYMQTYIRESDFSEIKRLGLNVVRIPFTYANLTADGKTLNDDAFIYLDFAIEACKKFGLLAILDLHGAIGSQNQDQHSGNDSEHNLYGNAENELATVSLWKKIAIRYKDEKTVAGYDLLNEPRKAYKKFSGKLNFDFYDRLYKAIRKIDKNHMIFIECFTFPIHGSRIQKYNWENVCMEYHIYNLTPFSQKFCLRFYNATNNLMRYRLPVYIGEWNAFSRKKDWLDSIEYFEKAGWSYSSWTYKTNKYFYCRNLMNANTSQWGIYELDIPPVNIAEATFEEIEKTYLKTSTDNAVPSLVYEVYSELVRYD